jgi:hypothetical protein
VYEVYDIVEGPSWSKMEEQWARDAELKRQQQRQRWESVGSVAPGDDAGSGSGQQQQLGRATRLVVIGRRLDQRKLQAGLDACAADGGG